MEKNDSLTFAENLIQIWARKKCHYDHKDGDKYSIEVDIEYSGGCPTCHSETPALIVYRYRTRYTPKAQKVVVDKKQVMSLPYANFSEILNEMLYALKPIED